MFKSLKFGRGVVCIEEIVFVGGVRWCIVENITVFNESPLERSRIEDIILYKKCLYFFDSSGSYKDTSDDKDCTECSFESSMRIC